MGKRRGRCVRRNKNKKNKALPEPEGVVRAPHSFVVHRGRASQYALAITKDFRRVMEPFTASHLKERKNNSIKDFVSVAGYLHVSHLCIFSMADTGLHLKVARLPRGPTLTFKVHDFCFARDVISSLKKQYFMRRAFETSPLVIMNGFAAGGEGAHMHLKLVANMFQNMFPAINVTDVRLRTIRRCVLLNYDPETKKIEFRHYYIKMSPVGLTRGTKKIVQGKVPDLKNCNDMSEFFEKAELLSESEREDDPEARVTLPQDVGSRGAKANAKSAVRLSELGPRLTLRPVKVEDGLLDGEVLFHEYVSKTEEEKEAIRKMRQAKEKLKEKRKKKQEENVARKREAKEKHKLKSLEGIAKRKERTESERLMRLADEESQRENPGLDDDDAEYYRRAVGEEPERDLFDKTERKKRRSDAGEEGPPVKKSRNGGGKEKNSKFGYGGPGKRSDAMKRIGGKRNGDFDRGDGKKRSGGRGGNPKYGWRARDGEENEKSNKKFGKLDFKSKGKGKFDPKSKTGRGKMDFKSKTPRGPSFKTKKQKFNSKFKKSKR